MPFCMGNLTTICIMTCAWEMGRLFFCKVIRILLYPQVGFFLGEIMFNKWEKIT
jgi:hypothetical protein